MSTKSTEKSKTSKAAAEMGRARMASFASEEEKSAFQSETAKKKWVAWRKKHGKAKPKKKS